MRSATSAGVLDLLTGARLKPPRNIGLEPRAARPIVPDTDPPIESTSSRSLPTADRKRGSALVDKKVPIEIPQMCHTHQALLVQQTGFKPSDPWRALMIVAQIALFQGATSRSGTYELIGNDVRRIGELGCLACYQPDRFGEIVQSVQTGGMGSVKELGESWLKGQFPSENDIG